MIMKDYKLSEIRDICKNTNVCRNCEFWDSFACYWLNSKMPICWRTEEDKKDEELQIK